MNPSDYKCDIYIRPEDTIFIVMDKKHSRYGQIGKMEYGHRVLNGIVGVRFPDQRLEEFSGRTSEKRGGDFNQGIKSFYRCLDNKGNDFDVQHSIGPRTFVETFLKINNRDIEKLVDQYSLLFGEDFPVIENEPA